MESIENVTVTHFGCSARLLKESEMEQASWAYLMTLMVGFIGLPLPIINLLGTLLYIFLNASKSPFVRFHQFQAFFSQIPIVIMNAVGLNWTIRILFFDLPFTHLYFGYIGTAFLLNLIDFVFNMIAATRVRKGHWYSFPAFGILSRRIVFPKDFN